MLQMLNIVFSEQTLRLNILKSIFCSTRKQKYSINVPCTLYLVAVHPKVLLQERFLRADESGVLLRYAFL